MKLKKILEIVIDHNSKNHKIRIDKNGFICLTDMAKFFPRKRLNKWMELKSTKELILLTDTPDSGYRSIITKKGGIGQGTFSCEDLAIDFAMWLDPVFKLKVLRSYRQQGDFIQDWNRSRIASSLANKLITEAIEQVKEDPKPHHYSNEAKMINKIVFGRHEKDIRDLASNNELELLNKLQSYNAAYIEIGIPYQERKETLTNFIQPKAVNE